jgi:hypothetical protein
MCKVWHCRAVVETANYVHSEHNLNKVLHNTIHHSLVINICIARYFLLINQSWIILCEFDNLFQDSKLIISHCSQENACASYQLYLLQYVVLKKDIK